MDFLCVSSEDDEEASNGGHTAAEVMSPCVNGYDAQLKTTRYFDFDDLNCDVCVWRFVNITLN